MVISIVEAPFHRPSQLIYNRCSRRMDCNNWCRHQLVQPNRRAVLTSSSSDAAPRAWEMSSFSLLTNFPITRLSNRTRQLTTYKFRSLKKVNWTNFKHDLHQSAVFLNQAITVDAFAIQIDTTVTEILNSHCPLIERKRFLPKRRNQRWISP